VGDKVKKMVVKDIMVKEGVNILCLQENTVEQYKKVGLQGVMGE